jgi:lipoprotein-anchoring transpeptidase ErfK/SrfK
MDAHTQEQFSQAIQKAQEAFRQGDKRSVHHWAETAASLHPEAEDPWLLLAAIGSPRASVAYLQRALQANPTSQRAQKGMQWALNRVREEEARLATQKASVQSIAAIQLSYVAEEDPTPTQPVHPVPSLAGTQPTRLRQKTEITQPVRAKPAPKTAETVHRLSPLSIGVLVFACLAVAAFVFIDITPASAFINSLSAPRAGSAGWSQALVQKPAQFSEPAFTPTPSAVAVVDDSVVQPTGTPFPTITVAPTETATPETSPTPMATDIQVPSPTPLPTDTSAPLPESQPSNPYTGSKYILVDISEQHLYAYDGDTLVYSFVASTGMRGATRVGTFSVLDKIPNAYGSTWNIWMPDWLGIYYSGSLENGIHSLPILPGGQRLWAGYLGTPISYGCVVLGIDESRQLYDWADIGTPVTIQY